MQPSARSQKGILISIFVVLGLMVGNVFLGFLLDDGSGLWALGLFGLPPTFIVIGILAFIYQKNQRRLSRNMQKSNENEFSWARVITTLTMLASLAIVTYAIIWIFRALDQS